MRPAVRCRGPTTPATTRPSTPRQGGRTLWSLVDRTDTPTDDDLETAGARLTTLQIALETYQTVVSLIANTKTVTVRTVQADFDLYPIGITVTDERKKAIPSPDTSSTASGTTRSDAQENRYFHSGSELFRRPGFDVNRARYDTSTAIVFLVPT